ncbi:hypothetical protein GMA12_11660 [Kocuria sediminis]|uniref:Uncharacterized protein n=1 Tax=Kocuria sediminis TaxID=1038857 RepID=A0A6N8GLL7_9MICC|nr:hypothetical protein [Kocuria sediminis]MUN63788.1 hypothetical protein [Kocuria sediminis]
MDDLLGGTVEEFTLERGQVQSLVEIGVDLELLDAPTDTDEAPPQLVDRDTGMADGVVQYPSLLDFSGLEHAKAPSPGRPHGGLGGDKEGPAAGPLPWHQKIILITVLARIICAFRTAA